MTFWAKEIWGVWVPLSVEMLPILISVEPNKKTPVVKMIKARIGCQYSHVSTVILIIVSMP